MFLSYTSPTALVYDLTLTLLKVADELKVWE